MSGLGNALGGGIIGQYVSGMSISPYGGQQTQGRWGYDQLVRQYGAASGTGHVSAAPKKKKPERPIEELQAEVDEWLKDCGI